MCHILLVAAIGNAFAVLSNPDKRLRYDQYGDEQVTFTAPRARSYHYYRDFEADISPEELFNVFFGGHFPSGWYFFFPACMSMHLVYIWYLYVCVCALCVSGACIYVYAPSVCLVPTCMSMHLM